MSSDNNWKQFWKISAECANESIRAGEILTETNEIRSSVIFKTVLSKYLKNFQLMDREMQINKLSSKKILYRNIHIDIYSDLKIDETLYHSCFVSCFNDTNNDFFGGINLKIIVHSDSPYLEYENTIILPSGYYKLVEKNNQNYTIELVESFCLFQT